jgi:hypothetical protein
MEAISPKLLRLEADYSPPSSAELEKEWGYTSTSSHTLMTRTGTVLLFVKSNYCLPAWHCISLCFKIVAL